VNAITFKNNPNPDLAHKFTLPAAAIGFILTCGFFSYKYPFGTSNHTGCKKIYLTFQDLVAQNKNQIYEALPHLLEHLLELDVYHNLP
jgi:hypothetical protein